MHTYPKKHSDTKYGFLSPKKKRNPHCPYASGDTSKEKLTKRLCSLVDNSIVKIAAKKFHLQKIPPLTYTQPIEIKARGKSI